MTIIIETINHKDQRYNTAGDWQWRRSISSNEDQLLIKVSETGNDKMNACIAIHELVEALLCKFHEPEITTEQVDAFDMAHPELDEPGEQFEAPYYLQHFKASFVERIIAQEIKLDWKEYEERIKSL